MTDEYISDAQRLRQEQLRAAQAVQGQSALERRENLVQQEKIVQKNFKDNGFSNVLFEVAKENIFPVTRKAVDSIITPAVEVAEERLEEAPDYVSKNPLLSVGNTAKEYIKAVSEELFKKDYVDPNWKPRENPTQKQQILTAIEQRGLDIESPEAIELLQSESEEELYGTVKLIDDAIERNQRILDAGSAGAAVALVSSMVDVDLVAGGALTKSGVAAYKARALGKAVQAGKISTNEAKFLARATNRAENALIGAVSTGASTGALMAADAALDPTVSTENVLGSIVMATFAGGGFGAMQNPHKASKITKHLMSDIKLSETVHTAKNIPEVQVAKQQKEKFTNTLNFIRTWEGGLANSKIDLGGATAFGISSKYWPKEYKEIVNLYKTRGTEAAQDYQEKFMKQNFYDKVVTPEMTKEQALVMTDTAFNFGVNGAKNLYKKAKGNVNKMLELRMEHYRQKVIDDPTQAGNMEGWTNRVDDLKKRLLNQETELKGTAAIRNSIDLDQSVGAAKAQQVDETGNVISDDPEIFTANTSKVVIDQAQKFFDENPDIADSFLFKDEFIDRTSDDPASLPVRLSRQLGQYLYEGIQKTPFISDFDRLSRDAGTVGKYLAYLTIDSPIGQVVNNRSAHAVGDLIQRKVQSLYAPNSGKHYNEWAKSKNIPLFSKDRFFKGRKEFDRELYEYREALYNNRPAPDVHPNVKEASDELDRAYQELLQYNKKYAVEGFEDVDHKAGFTPRSWDGKKLSAVENTAGVGSAGVVQSIKKAIMANQPEIEENLAFIYANAIRRTAKNKQVTNSPTGQLSSVNLVGKLALEEAIQDLGLATGEAASEMADKILYKNNERGIVKGAKKRIDLDLSTPIDGTDYTLMDLVDTDVYGLTEKAVRGQSNHAALASIGIQNRDKEHWIVAARDEANALGTDPEKAVKAVQDIFSYFGEGAYGGGSGVAAARLNRLANLMYLGQLGITQIAEIGVAMGVTGIKGWVKYAGKTLPDMLKGKDPEILKSLGGALHYTGDHKLLIRADHLDEADLGTKYDLLKISDRLTNIGSRALGYLSGFYKITEWIQTVAALSLNDYVVRQIKNNVDNTRLRSMGVDDEYRALINKRIADGSIKFDEDGNVSDMSVESWDYDETELLELVTKRNVDTAVQRTRRGEGQTWAYGQLGSLLMSLKSYVTNAMQKQLIKNLRNADDESLAMLLTTTGTAALAYTAKQIVNGKTENLNTEDIAKGAMNWSSMLSPAMFALDPLTYLLDIDTGGFKHYDRGLISAPAGLSALNDLISVGKLPSDIATADTVSQKLKALKSIPILGRSLPMSASLSLLE